MSETKIELIIDNFYEFTNERYPGYYMALQTNIKRLFKIEFMGKGGSFVHYGYHFWGVETKRLDKLDSYLTTINYFLWKRDALCYLRKKHREKEKGKHKFRSYKLRFFNGKVGGMNPSSIRNELPHLVEKLGVLDKGYDVKIVNLTKD